MRTACPNHAVHNVPRCVDGVQERDSNEPIDKLQLR